jgi:hypothetical protein
MVNGRDAGQHPSLACGIQVNTGPHRFTLRVMLLIARYDKRPPNLDEVRNK